jgi:hypothetical protein
VTCDETETDTEAPAVGPDFSMILPIENLSLEVGTQWPFRLESPENKGIGMTPMFTDWDFRLVRQIVVSIVGQNDTCYHCRISGVTVGGREGSPPTITIDTMFEYRGVTDHDETGAYTAGSPFSSHLKSKGNWQKYIVDEFGLQSGNGLITEYEWQHTDRFRRLIGKLFEIHSPPVSAPAPAASGVFERLRRLFRRTPVASQPSISSNVLPTPTLRQTKLLLAACLEQLLPNERCWVWNLSATEMARMVERFAEGVPTADDQNRVALHNPTMCIIPGGMICLSAEDIASSATSQLFRMPSIIPPGMAGDLFIWRLVPERSRVGCDLLKCIFGNPFRSVEMQSGWRTENVIGLAEAAYDLRDFSRLPILADALQEAGCEQDAILSHCRDAKIHTRGCWVLNAILQRDR